MRTDLINDPRTTNRGVENTISKEKNYSIDWFCFTSGFGITYKSNNKPDEKSIFFINDLFWALGLKKQYSDFELYKSGQYGYQWYQDIEDGIQIRYCGPINKENKRTWRLELKGRGCDFLSQMSDWKRFFTFIKAFEISIKRIDLAIDDYEGNEISFDYLYEKLKNEEYVLKQGSSGNPDIHQKLNDLSKKSTVGMTIDVYSKSSSVNLCIYDKLVEQQVHHNYDAPFKQWIRYEMRFMDEKGDYAFNNYFNYLLKDDYSAIAELLSGLLYELLKLKVPGIDLNKSRWDDDPLWIDFLGDVKSINFERLETKKTDIQKKKEWIECSVSRALCEIFLVKDLGFVIIWIRDLINKQIPNLKDSHINDINNQRRKFGLNPITWHDIATQVASVELSEEELEYLKDAWQDINKLKI